MPRTGESVSALRVQVPAAADGSRLDATRSLGPPTITMADAGVPSAFAIVRRDSRRRDGPPYDERSAA